MATPAIKAGLALVGGVRAAIFLALSVAFGATAVVQSIRLDSAQADRDKWQAAANTSLEANRTNQQTIADLQEANRRWAALLATRAEDSAAAVAAVERERDALADEVKRRRAERETLYGKDQSAAEWGRTRVPDSVLRELRK